MSGGERQLMWLILVFCLSMTANAMLMVVSQGAAQYALLPV